MRNPYTFSGVFQAHISRYLQHSSPLKDFIKNPQTTIALTFMTLIISGIDDVTYHPPSSGYDLIALA